jgi:hypothetical protein
LDLGAVPPITRQSRRYRREEMILSWLSGIGGDAVLVTNPLHNWSPTSRPARRHSVSATVGGEDRTIRHSHSQRQSLSGASRSTSQDRRRGSSCKILCCCSRGYHTGRRPPRTRSACRTPPPRLVSLLPTPENGTNVRSCCSHKIRVSRSGPLMLRNSTGTSRLARLPERRSWESPGSCREEAAALRT